MERNRLFLRESTFEDCHYFAKWEQDPNVTTFFTINDGRDYEEITREFFEREADKSQKQFTICLNDSKVPIGRVYVSSINYHYDSLDISRIYIADQNNRGKGFGEEALMLTLKWAFEDMKMERVTLDHFTGNNIAGTLYEKVGFKREGVMRHGGKKNGKYVDLHLMSMLRDEYFG